jgi:hypothetical protein
MKELASKLTELKSFCLSIQKNKIKIKIKI